MTSPSPLLVTPWVRRLLAAKFGVYLLSATVFTGAWFTGALAFAPGTAAARPWTFATYLFVHDGWLHLAVSLLMLLMFGPAVERRMGGWGFLRFYLLCGLGGPALAFGLSLFLRSVTPIVGASAAVYGVALAFALYWPHARIFVFPLPWPVPVKVLVAALAVLTLLPFLLDLRHGLPHLAHLGGFLLGFAYLKGEHLMERRATVTTEPPTEAPVLVAHPPAAESADRPADRVGPRAGGPDDVAREMDRVLDKISQHGLASLTAAERRFLDEMSRQMRRQ